MNLEPVAVVGASGYSGEELVRLLSRHPGVDLVALTSRQLAGQTVETVFPKFAGLRYSQLAFIESSVDKIVATGARTVFLALPHGVAAEYAKPLVDAKLRVIDLSADFRIKDAAVYQEFYGEAAHAPELAAISVYGLPEIYREQIRNAQLVASPGCYPTSAIVPLYPLLKRRMLKPESIIINSLSGVSGAGRTAKVDYLYVECNESVRAYSVPKHRHLAEIEQELSNAYGEDVTVSFVPHLIPVNRGIATTIHATPADGIGLAEISQAYKEAYANEPFVRLLGEKGTPDTKNVTFTNFIDVAWRHDPRTGRMVLLSAEDNLVKGAAGQAVQSLNVMCGWPETTALL
ncbi:N-acetyl-gamma-glutamyl-phosphate reductase [Chthoniobacter flavus]|nr:N-acetyl-gamma-glutamyl-phosphate reductase [Chthoniobacter flavus]TCO94124.1 N-acetyl-gamma-glutamyl-phosphate reductase [Chthoniobacter flavus]